MSINLASHISLEAICKRVCLMACALACVVISLGICVSPAHAEVRNADLLVGTSVEARGVSPALCPSIDAEFAILVDDKGKVYFERDADVRTHIASITKVMTAIVALENFPLDTEIKVGASAAAVGESSSELKDGDTLTLEQALNGLLVSSGNDAAIAISNTLGGFMKTEGQNGIDAFVAAMNAKAAELNMTNTLFANAHGLDYDQYEAEMYSTARDVATMCSYAMRNETFRNIVAQDEVTLTVKRANGETAKIELESTDVMIGVYEGACGIKTGFTSLAGQCFAGAAQRNGDYLYAIVLNSSSEDQRFVDAETLYDWVYDNTFDYPFVHSSESVVMSVDGQMKEVPVVAHVDHLGWPDVTVAATISDPDAVVRVFSLEGNVSQRFEIEEPNGTVREGDLLGTVSFYQRNVLLATFDVIAAEHVKAPSIFEKIGIWWGSLLGDQDEANENSQTVIINETPLIYEK